MAQITEDELLQIANGYLLTAPPGEFNEVVSDVRQLVNNDALLNRTALNIFKQYNTEQMIQVTNGDHEVLITKSGEINETDYLDPRGNCVISFDHIKQLISSTRPITSELDATAEPFRRAIDDTISNYINEHYQNGTATVYGSSKGNDITITICISSSKFNPNNFWNGRFRSVWVVRFGKSGGTIKLEGKVNIAVHYYEDGNVQLSTSWKKNAEVKANDAKSIAESVAKLISKLEQDYQSSVENSYNTMGETTFKALRRVLPITRQRIDWQKIRLYKVGAEVAK